MKELSLLLMMCLMLTLSPGCGSEPTAPADTGPVGSIEMDGGTETPSRPDWSDLTADGLDEDAFRPKLDTALLQDIAAKLQSVVEETQAEERADQSIILSEGPARVFRKEQYLDVIGMGERAELPLYYILYKSPNDGLYEYLCAVALSQLTGLDFMDASGDHYAWTSGKGYLALFQTYMAGTRTE